MVKALLRSALRERTAELHEKLDRQVGVFDSVDNYADYVQRSFLFRAAIEPSLSQDSAWGVQHLRDLLGQDLADLGRQSPHLPAHRPPLTRPGAQMGALYVLEGSSVGARLLFKRAKALGFDQDKGAKHLAKQAQDLTRWPQFLALLEHTPEDQHEDVLSAGEDTFRLALEVYSAEP